MRVVEEMTRHGQETPLPLRRLAIEASAGTGKTYALADLAVRFVAERGVPVSELLMVTFTRAATGELRDRVRSRLIEVATRLEHAADARHPCGDPTDGDDGAGPDDGPSGRAGDGDPLIDYLAASDPALRAHRLKEAVAEFDQATVTTIHGFARQVRSALGASAGVDPDAHVEDDENGMLEEVCSDVLAAAAMSHAATELPTFAGLTAATRQRAGRADMEVVPGPGISGRRRTASCSPSSSGSRWTRWPTDVGWRVSAASTSC